MMLPPCRSPWTAAASARHSAGSIRGSSRRRSWAGSPGEGRARVPRHDEAEVARVAAADRRRGEDVVVPRAPAGADPRGLVREQLGGRGRRGRVVGAADRREQAREEHRVLGEEGRVGAGAGELERDVVAVEVAVEDVAGAGPHAPKLGKKRRAGVNRTCVGSVHATFRVARAK